MKHQFRREVAWCFATTFAVLIAQPAHAQIGWSKQELVARAEKASGQLRHDATLAGRVVDACAPQLDRYFRVFQQKGPDNTQRRFTTEISQEIATWALFGFDPEFPFAEAARQAKEYTESIGQRRQELREHPERTIIPDMIVEFEKERCIREVAARMSVSPVGVGSSDHSAPTSLSGQPATAPAAPPVPVTRVFTDAAAAAAAVTAQVPGNLDKYDHALSARSSAEVKRDKATDVLLGDGWRAIARQLPVPQCSDRQDRAAFAQCLKVRNETIFKLAEAQMALLDRERPNLTAASYELWKLLFVRDANLARNSCAKLAGSTALCDLSTAGSSRPSLPSRVIARDGRRALDCVSLEHLARSNASTSGAGSVLVNRCTDTVTIGWCSTGGECERGLGNLWNVAPGRSWPVDANHEVRWGACHGANTLHGDPGSKGLQFTCSAPDTDP